MKLGFKTSNTNQESSAYPSTPTVSVATTDIWKILKGIRVIVAIIVLLFGVVWGGATIYAGTASDDDLDILETRVEMVEKNAIKQTLLLEYIKETVDKFEKKLDRVLER